MHLNPLQTKITFAKFYINLYILAWNYVCPQTSVLRNAPIYFPTQAGAVVCTFANRHVYYIHSQGMKQPLDAQEQELYFASMAPISEKYQLSKC